MRNLLVLSAAASVLALGMTTHQAAALLPGTNAISLGGLLQKAQKTDEKGPSTRGQEGGGKAAPVEVAGKVLAPLRIKGATGVPRRIRVIGTDKCAQVIKECVVVSDAPMSTSMSMEGVATGPKGIPGSTSMPIAGADLTDAMSMST